MSTQNIHDILKQHVPRQFDFIGIGQAKSGTSALWYYLMMHPDVFSGPPETLHDHTPFPLWKWFGKNNDTPWVGLEMKEPNFFNIDHNRYDVVERLKIKKYKTWLDSIDLFASPDKMLTEFTVHYMDERETLERIKIHSPNVKIFAILRDPVYRFYSHLNWNNNVNSMEEWEQKIDLIMSKSTKELIIQKSMYSEKIQNCFEIFGEDKVKFIKYEDFRDNNERVVFEVLQFLGLDVEKYQFKQEYVLLKPWVSPIPKRLLDHLYQIFQPEISKIETLLGWDCSDWYKY